MNARLFDQAGVEFPIEWMAPNTYTWDDLFPLLQEITKLPDTYGICLAAGTVTGASGWTGREFNQILWGFGGQWAYEGDDPWTWQSAFDTEAAMKAFKVYYDAFNVYEVVPPDVRNWGRGAQNYANEVVAATIECPCLWEQLATQGRPMEIEPTIRATKPFPFPTEQSTPKVAVEANADVVFSVGSRKKAAFQFMRTVMKNQEHIWQWTWRQPGEGGARSEELEQIAQLPGLRPLIWKYNLDYSWWMADNIRLMEPPFARRNTSCPILPTSAEFEQVLMEVCEGTTTPQQAATSYHETLNNWLKDQGMYFGT
jgi:ABC-type glycerol-3-phosphate transport system substrate-binding protein